MKSPCTKMSILSKDFRGREFHMHEFFYSPITHDKCLRQKKSQGQNVDLYAWKYHFCMHENIMTVYSCDMIC